MPSFYTFKTIETGDDLNKCNVKLYFTRVNILQPKAEKPMALIPAK